MVLLAELKNTRTWLQSGALRSLVVFVVFAAIFLLFHANANYLFSLDDPYYHAKHGWLMWQTKNFTLVEPWLTHHFLTTMPVDGWWGFHVLIALSSGLFGSLWGIKVVAALLAALGFTSLYTVLRWHGVKHALVWVFLAFGTSGGYLTRLLFERPHILTLTAIPLGWWFITQKKYVCLAILTMAYMLSYELAPVLVIFTIGYAIVEWYQTKTLDLKLGIAALGGMTAGILLHPHSLHYLYLIQYPLWRILLLRFQGVDLGIGGEVQMAPIERFASQNASALILFILATALFFALPSLRRSARHRPLTALALATGAWLVMSALVIRAIEYWLPLVWLFIPLTFTAVATTEESLHLKKHIQRWLSGHIVQAALGMALLIIAAAVISNTWMFLSNRNAHPTDPDHQEVVAWLADHSAPKEIVFNTNWGDWPQLFYYSDYNRYVIGMDPTFLYDYNQEAYWLWRSISVSGASCNQDTLCPELSPRVKLRLTAPTIRRVFDSRYVLTTNDETIPSFRVFSTLDQQFKKVFENDSYTVFEVMD